MGFIPVDYYRFRMNYKECVFYLAGAKVNKKY